MAYVDPGSTNTFLPQWDATSAMVAFIRDPAKFQLNAYGSWRPALKPVGIYTKFESEQAIRVNSLEEFSWADGAVAPDGNGNLMGHRFPSYRTQRFAMPFNLGNRTRASCPWDIAAIHAQMAISQFMTHLTYKVCTTLDATATWAAIDGMAAAHTDTATNLGGAKWDVSTTSNNAIQKSLYAAFQAILDDTNSAATMDDVRVVIGPETARKMRTSPELLDYIKGSPTAMAQLAGELPNANKDFGLPARLFGFEIVVEKAQRVTTRKNAGSTATRSYIKDVDKAVMVSKQDALPGDFVSDTGSIPNFSTFQIFNYVGEDKNTRDDGSVSGGFPFVVEMMEDVINRRLMGRVVGDYWVEVVAPESGYMISDVLT